MRDKTLRSEKCCRRSREAPAGSGLLTWRSPATAQEAGAYLLTVLGAATVLWCLCRFSIQDGSGVFQTLWEATLSLPCVLISVCNQS